MCILLQKKGFNVEIVITVTHRPTTEMQLARAEFNLIMKEHIPSKSSILASPTGHKQGVHWIPQKIPAVNCHKLPITQA